MKKLFFIFIFFASCLFSSEIKQLENIDEIVEDKITFLVFSTDYCPWCAKQKRVLENIDVKRDNLQMFYINDSSKLFETFIKEYSLSIKYFPTTYIIIKEEGELSILYEFQGYQRESNILKVLDDENSF